MQEDINPDISKTVRVARSKGGRWVVSQKSKGGKQHYYATKKSAVAKGTEIAKASHGKVVVFGESGEVVELKKFPSNITGLNTAGSLIQPGFGGAADNIVLKPGFDDDLQDFAEYV